MAEERIAGRLSAVVALPVMYFGPRFRTGRSLEAVAGCNPGRVRDQAGCGRLVLNPVARTGLLTLAPGALIAFVPDRIAPWAVPGLVAALRVPEPRLALGVRKFYPRWRRG